MACYLVTGVAGFIGGVLARRLLAEGHEVISIDNLTTGQRENIPAGVQFFEGDCQNPALYESILPVREYDAIFHIAGQSSGEISFDDPVYDLRTNTESTLLLLKFALKTGCTRFVYASTMSVYGTQPDGPVSEDASLAPLSFYGVGKLASEHYLRLYEQFGVRSTALRLFNVYGPGQNMANLRQGMVSIFMAMMEKDGHIIVKGSPTRFRDFVYIDDVVEAFMLCLTQPLSAGRVINVASGVKTQVGTLVENLRRLSGEGATVEYSGSTAGDMHGIVADLAAAAKYLGYEPAVSLQEGLHRMYTWYREGLQG